MAKAKSGTVQAALCIVAIRDDEGVMHFQTLSQGGIKSETMPVAPGFYGLNVFFDKKEVGSYKPPTTEEIKVMSDLLEGKIQADEK